MTTKKPEFTFERLAFPDENRRQQQAFRIAYNPKYKHILYGGAMGGGKSRWLRWTLLSKPIILYAKYGITGIETMLACESYVALRDRQIVKIRREFPDWLGVWKESAREFRLHEKWGGGALVLRNLADPQQYLSSEFCCIGIDEATRNAANVRTDLSTRVRWPGIPDHEYKMFAATNPGGIGHAEYQRLFLLKKFSNDEDPSEYVYIPARASDNPALPPGYIKQLMALPAKLREAYVNGNWDVFAGQFFPEFDVSVHIIEPFQIPRQFERVRALDWGYYPGYTAVGWFAIDTMRSLAYQYRELYIRERTPEQVAERIKSMTGDDDITYTVADPSVFRTNEQTRKSIADVFAANDVPLVPANNNRLQGWAIMREYLRVFDALLPDYVPTLPDVDRSLINPCARLRIFNTCPETARTIPTVIYDDRNMAVERNIEDAKKGGEDHLAEMVRYFCASRPPYERVGVDPERLRLAEAERVIREEEERDGRTKRRFSAGW